MTEKITETKLKERHPVLNAWVTEDGETLEPFHQIEPRNTPKAAPGVRVGYMLSPLGGHNWITRPEPEPITEPITEPLDVSGTITDAEGNDMRVVESLNRIANTLEKIEKHLSTLSFKAFNP